MIKRRAGTTTPTVADWTDSTAIKKADSIGKMSNTLAIEVGKDKVALPGQRQGSARQSMPGRSTRLGSPACASTTTSTSTSTAS